MLMKHLAIETEREFQTVNVTLGVQSLVPPGFNGLCFVVVPHTTAALVVGEHDPDFGTDLERLGKVMFDAWGPYEHRRGNVPNAGIHLFNALAGNCVVVPVINGALQLGQWQGILLVELSGPRTRQLWVCFLD